MRRKTSARTLAEVIEGADVFLGLSAGGVLKQDMVAQDERAPAASSRWPTPRPRSRPKT